MDITTTVDILAPWREAFTRLAERFIAFVTAILTNIRAVWIRVLYQPRPFPRLTLRRDRRGRISVRAFRVVNAFDPYKRAIA